MALMYTLVIGYFRTNSLWHSHLPDPRPPALPLRPQHYLCIAVYSPAKANLVPDVQTLNHPTHTAHRPHPHTELPKP